MTWLAGYEGASGHVLDYDPRRDIDRICEHAITRCGKRLSPDRLGDDWRKLCRSCLELMALDRQTIVW